MLSLSVNPGSRYKPWYPLLCLCFCHNSKIGKNFFGRCVFECEILHSQRPPRCIVIGATPHNTIHIMAKFAITSYKITPRGIGLSGGDITPDTASDEFKWVAPGDRDFPAAVAAVKALREGEEERIAEHQKMLEELF